MLNYFYVAGLNPTLPSVRNLDIRPRSDRVDYLHFRAFVEYEQVHLSIRRGFRGYDRLHHYSLVAKEIVVLLVKRKAESRAPKQEADYCCNEPGAFPSCRGSEEEKQQHRADKNEEYYEYDCPSIRVEKVAEPQSPCLQDKFRNGIYAVLRAAVRELQIVAGIRI